jgi:hypothetical protein
VPVPGKSGGGSILGRLTVPGKEGMEAEQVAFWNERLLQEAGGVVVSSWPRRTRPPSQAALAFVVGLIPAGFAARGSPPPAVSAAVPQPPPTACTLPVGRASLQSARMLPCLQTLQTSVLAVAPSSAARDEGATARWPGRGDGQPASGPSPLPLFASGRQAACPDSPRAHRRPCDAGEPGARPRECRSSASAASRWPPP